jgi:hypothetical protein
MASHPNARGRHTRMPPITTPCIVRCRTPPRPHRHPPPRTRSRTARRRRPRRRHIRRNFPPSLVRGRHLHGAYTSPTSSSSAQPSKHETRGAALGCFVNTFKTRILTSCNNSSPIETIMATDPTLGQSISTTIATFSNEPDPSNSTSTRPVELTSGFRLLGHPVGSASFASSFFDKHTPTL